MSGAKLQDIYNTSLSLLTDQYQLTMSYGYWKMGMADKEAVFHLFFRKKPFKGGYTLSAGLDNVINYLENFRFEKSDLQYLASLKDVNNDPLFEKGFFDYLSDMKFSCSVDSVPEGSVVFPYEPMIRVQGPLIQCQILETPLLNLTNFASLIATKASRVCHAAENDTVIEFGLRRSQGIDGALTAARSAFIGGCDSTSNVLAGKLYGIPVSGTHSHSWIMVFDTELEAFETYAKALPTNCVFLVDTYNTLNGVKRAIEVGRKLKENGFKMLGIRLDSGDLSYLSMKSRELLDSAGFKDVEIVASNELDEYLISDLKRQGAQIAVWGVGTNLATAKDQPALDGVYKISAIREPGAKWTYKIKLSEQLSKVSNPGLMQVRRYYNGYENIGDAIYDIETGDLSQGCTIVDPFDSTRKKEFANDLEYEDLLVPIFRDGKKVYESPSLQEIQNRAKKELSRFHKGIKRFYNPHQYPVGMETSLYDMKIKLVEKIRSKIAPSYPK